MDTILYKGWVAFCPILAAFWPLSSGFVRFRPLLSGFGKLGKFANPTSDECPAAGSKNSFFSDSSPGGVGGLARHGRKGDLTPPHNSRVTHHTTHEHAQIDTMPICLVAIRANSFLPGRGGRLSPPRTEALRPSRGPKRRTEFSKNKGADRDLIGRNDPKLFPNNDYPGK
jgi:hypothetical protein